MEITEFTRRLEYLKADLEIVKKDNYHPRCHDLLEMIVTEEVPELIKFVEKVNKIFEGNPKDIYEDGYVEGYIQCYIDLKKDIYGK